MRNCSREEEDLKVTRTSGAYSSVQKKSTWNCGNSLRKSGFWFEIHPTLENVPFGNSGIFHKFYVLDFSHFWIREQSYPLWKNTITHTLCGMFQNIHTDLRLNSLIMEYIPLFTRYLLLILTYHNKYNTESLNLYTNSTRIRLRVSE